MFKAGRNLSVSPQRAAYLMAIGVAEDDRPEVKVEPVKPVKGKKKTSKKEV